MEKLVLLDMHLSRLLVTQLLQCVTGLEETLLIQLQMEQLTIPLLGQVTVTFPDPVTPLTTKDRIAFKEGAITFNCSDNGGGSHASPERFDSNFGKDYAITNVNSAGGNTTVTCTVPTGGTAQSAYTFVSALTDGTVLIYDTVETCSAIPKFVDWNILLDSTAAQAIKLITPTTATYDPATGDFVITSAGHGLTHF